MEESFNEGIMSHSKQKVSWFKSYVQRTICKFM